MFRWLLTATLLTAAACQSALSTPTPQPVLSVQSSGAATASPVGTWREETINGVTLGITVPHGWADYPSEHGILLVDHRGSAGGSLSGVVVNIFVPRMEPPTPQPAQNNVAWVTLKQVTELPHEYGLGNAVTTEPAALEWDGHDAAYYLVNDGNGNLTLLLAVVLPRENRFVIFNFSAPENLAPRIRWMLPNLLSTLEINGATLSVEALDTLPNPLPYPEYEPKHTPVAPHYQR